MEYTHNEFNSTEKPKEISYKNSPKKKLERRVRTIRKIDPRFKQKCGAIMLYNIKPK